MHGATIKNLLFNWYRWLLPGGKATGCEVDHLYLLPRLIMSGVIPPLIHCAFMACIGTTLPVLWPARSLLTVVTKLSRFCYLVLRRPMFFFLLRSHLQRIVRPNWGTPNFMVDLRVVSGNWVGSESSRLISFQESRLYWLVAFCGGTKWGRTSIRKSSSQQ